MLQFDGSHQPASHRKKISDINAQNLCQTVQPLYR